MTLRLSLCVFLSAVAASAQSRPVAVCTDAIKPTIVTPLKGGSVVLTDLIRGVSPCPTMKHYVVVTPSNGTDWIQNKPFTFGANALFTTQAQFGEGSVGINDTFLIRILVTKDTLPPGQLRQMPTDAILSEAVSVKRNR